MDYFTPYEDDFEQALDTLEKVLQRCIATRLCLSHEKCHMMMIEGIILNHYISAARIQELDITTKDRPGKENPVADFLSRMPKPADAAAVEVQFPDEHLFVVTVRTPWYADVANYLAVGVDVHIKRCVHEDEIFDILKAFHDGPCGRHFVEHRTGHKVLQTGYYLPTIFKDAKKFVQACDSFQRVGCPGQSEEMPLNPQLVIEPFENWGLDFIGLINPSSNQKTYILVATEYVTKWVEAKTLRRATEDSVIHFLFQIFV
eukprot:PITA_16527